MSSMNVALSLAVGLLLLVGCDGDGGTDAGRDAGASDAGGGDAGPSDAGVDAGPPFMPDSYCPGPADCPSGDDGTFSVGAARRAITPVIDAMTDVVTLDVDGDGEFEPGEGDQFADNDGVPGFQGVWMAGFGNARPATGVHDELYASAVVLENGDTTIAFVSLDVIGWFKPDMDDIRERVADLGIDHIAIGATHTHQGRDTIGIWGLTSMMSGLDPAYNERVRAEAAQAIRDAFAGPRRAHVQVASTDLRDIEGGLSRLVGDNRDPNIVDPEMRMMRFIDASDDSTIATLVNFGAHAEYMDDQNTLLSSDWPHYFRQGVESGVIGPDGSSTAGVGGITVFMQSAIGGQIGPNHITVRSWDGTELIQRDDVYLYTQTVGEQLAYHALTALGPTGGSTTQMNAALGYRTRTFNVLVENAQFHIAIALGLFDREGVDWDPDMPLVVGENQPSLDVEVTVIDVGDVQMITAPGELEPELFLGGYDGSYTPSGMDIVDPTNPNPPMLDDAPPGPYLRDLARSDAESVWLLGLTNDYLGYLMDSYNFVVDEASPYIVEADGDHYEETNSVGAMTWPTIHHELEQLLGWTP
ncbi:MAG: neutral/alkaline non-lysosomal ceramidase N-terminal domain-containing protein [Sandaracinaceae bacterium]